MQIELRKTVTAMDIPLEIKELYHSSFPVEEQRPWADIEQRINSKDTEFSFYVLQHKTKNIGFITLWRLPQALYCEHLALFPESRGGGYGEAVVRRVIEMAQSEKDGAVLPLVLEVELPEESEFARRRVGFYQRCGMQALTDFKYVQPGYTPELPPVDLMLMVSEPVDNPAEIAKTLHTVVYNRPDFNIE